jgi:hypothetical protein
MKESAPNPFDRRVSEAKVAAILACIAEPPGKRTQPNHDDAPGDFDFWFDGGACKYHTGSAHYDLTEGTRAVVACPAHWLWVRVSFSDGRSVVIHQQNP